MRNLWRNREVGQLEDWRLLAKYKMICYLSGVVVVHKRKCMRVRMDGRVCLVVVDYFLTETV
jgi:hypothetical protein